MNDPNAGGGDTPGADHHRAPTDPTESVDGGTHTGDGSPATPEPAREIDLDAVERDLNGVETALGRLDEGTYWTDEVTGEEIPDEILAENPAARRT